MQKNLIPCLCLVSALYAPAGQAADEAQQCLTNGQWAIPADQGARPASTSRVLARARNADFVLLGEAHDNPDHHLWQLQTLGMLLGSRNGLVIGMEMFPRRVQPALDRWVAGELTESELLKQSEWERVWRFDPALYLPILRFARLNRIPVIALNVERQLISDIGKSGLSAIEQARREGVSDPEPASDDYRRILRSWFEKHDMSYEASFENFVEGQLVWDRAFAQALSEAHTTHPSALVVGIIGSGHLQYGHGVPHQLQSLGHDNVAVWLPGPASRPCDELANIADAVFLVEDSERPPPPLRLGVFLRDDEGGTTIREVLPGSVADEAGLASGDRIMSAAGIEVRASDDVIALVRRQSPGTWLPMTVARNGETIDVVAKFPAQVPAAAQ
ncbi:MAG: ChaN family lipoprotein [Betaproteobacteria bacterium]|nr:MAG: ChaN family lipoprotein [Betaproteobacteria bacterium]